MLAAALALLFAPLEVVDLQVEGPACAEVDSVMAATVRYLGREDLDQLDARIEARVKIVEGAKGWSVEIGVDLPEPHPDTQRVVEAVDCAEAIDIAGLIISVALDPVAVSREATQQRETQEAVEDAEKEAATPEPEPPPAPVEKPRERPGFRLAALGLLGMEQADAPTWGLAALGDVTGRGWQVGAHLRYWGPSADPIEGNEDAGVRLQSVLGGVRGCVVPRLSGWRFPACAVAEGGVLIATGYGLEVNQRTRLPLASVGVEQNFSWQLGERVSLDLSVGTGLQLVRPRVEIEGLGVVHARSPVTVRIGLGPSFRL